MFLNKTEKVEENEDAEEIVDEISTNEMHGTSIMSMDIMNRLE